MRVYETSYDRSVLPNMYIVARIDGRSFTRLTKEVHKFKSPFDERFRNHMVDTVRHLMNCGFNVVYGFTESDEISLLFDLGEAAFGRKVRKYISVLAGEASAKFSTVLGDVAAFDCRLSELPNRQLVVDYFRWRSEDAYRNALNAHCYWRLRMDNLSQKEAAVKIEHMSVAAKNEVLFGYGINFNELPNWQKRGIGVYWTEVIKEGVNPSTGERTLVKRRKLTTDFDLPMRTEYDSFIENLINKMEQKSVHLR